MTTAQVRRLYEARPFRPFRIHLADGRSLLVDHPEWLSFSPSGRTIVVNFKENGEDAFEIVDLLLVTSLEVGGNGKARKKRS